MPDNPYADGKIRGHRDGIIRAIVIGLAIVVAWNLPRLVLALSSLRRDHVRDRDNLSGSSARIGKTTATLRSLLINCRDGCGAQVSLATNRGRVVYFPSTGRQKDFHRQFSAILV